jgi:hypothetical protein
LAKITSLCTSGYFKTFSSPLACILAHFFLPLVLCWFVGWWVIFWTKEKYTSGFDHWSKECNLSISSPNRIDSFSTVARSFDVI